MTKIKYYIFCIKWLWNNRNWENTRQKFKAMERAYKKLFADHPTEKGGGSDA